MVNNSLNRNDDPLVSILIINYNGKHYLKNCFDSLYQGTYRNIEIIFIDNGSKDGSIEFVSENYKVVKVIDNKANMGLAIASNKGAEVAKGDYMFFYNNDTIAKPNLIESMVEVMEKNQSVGICGCTTYTYDGNSVLNAGVVCDIFGYPYGKGEPFYVDAGIFIRSDLFRKMGGFDEKMFLYGEDRDICWRCWLYGYKVVVADNAIFYHDSFCTSTDLNQYRTTIFKRFYGEFNALRSILKNYSLSFLLFILPLYAGVNLFEILMFLLRRNLKVVRDVYIKSYIENLRDIKDIMARRKKIQAERAVSDFEVIGHMNKISGKLKLLLDAGVPKFNG